MAKRRSTLNPTCPACGHFMNRNGRTKAGTQRWRCLSCGISCTDGPNTHGGHRRGILGGLRAAERMRKQQDKQKP